MFDTDFKRQRVEKRRLNYNFWGLKKGKIYDRISKLKLPVAQLDSAQDSDS